MSRILHLEARYSETPLEFLRRERWAVGICSLVFSAIMLAAIFSVDPAYYYPRLVTDQLLYYLKGLAFVHDGTTEARFAVNTGPFNYASGPGLLRAPWMALFPAFDDQLRAIQITNVVIAVALALISAYIMSWVLPRKVQAAAVAFAFALLVLNPVWVTNVLSPLADLPYAAASLGAVVVLTRILAGTPGERASLWRKILFAVLFVIAFACRFTAPVILVYGWFLYRSARSEGSSRPSRRVVLAAAAGVLAVVAVVLILRPGVVHYYAVLPKIFLSRSGIPEMLSNLVVLAVPSQLIPGLEIMFERPPLANMYRPVFATTPFDTLLTAIGIAISGITLAGMVILRRELRPGLAFVLVPMPLLASIIASSSRYLLSYQPFFWIFMYAGGAALVARLAPGFRWTRRMTITVASAACLLAATAVYVRSARFAAGGKVSISNFSLGETRRGAADVASTYRRLRQFLEGLPRAETLLVGTRGNMGQWKAIAGIDYYYPDSGMVDASRRKQLYLVLACPTPGVCSSMDHTEKRARDNLLTFGNVELARVFDVANAYSAARVYQVKVLQ